MSETQSPLPAYESLCELCISNNFKIKLQICEEELWHIQITREGTTFVNLHVAREDIDKTSQSIIGVFKEKKLWM